MNNFKNKIPIIAGILFLMANVIAVLSAWITDTHRYDLGISFSAYVGLSRPTSVVWFVSAVIIITMLIYYIAKTKIILFKKIIYAVVLLCIFGTALFPYNFFSEAPTAITINLHNDFAICLMLVTTVSFILSAIFSKSKKQRIVSLTSIVYAVAFIVLYFIRFQPLFQTFFVWENGFILLLLLEMQYEQYVAIKAESNN
ncbi:MAG: hypothetical protein IKJ68_11685 [Clostridia bacterium]|nr:hypothetical protein [Clostridia bacterium]